MAFGKSTFLEGFRMLLLCMLDAGLTVEGSVDEQGDLRMSSSAIV